MIFIARDNLNTTSNDTIFIFEVNPNDFIFFKGIIFP